MSYSKIIAQLESKKCKLDWTKDAFNEKYKSSKTNVLLALSEISYIYYIIAYSTPIVYNRCSTVLVNI